MILLEFFKSPTWRDLQTKFLATVGLSGVGTVAGAYPEPVLTQEYADKLLHIDLLIKYLSIGSYILSALVGITVLARFIYWVIDRQKNKNNNGSTDNNG